jgi:hypothetical protein
MVVWALFAISLLLAIVSARGESRAPKTSEGELAIELFGIVAEQSSCAIYIVAWLDSVTQQVRCRCAETLPEAKHFAAKLETKAKLLIDVSKAKDEFRRRFGNGGLHRPTSLLAYLLFNFRDEAIQRHASAPVLVYEAMIRIEVSGKKDEFELSSNSGREDAPRRSARNVQFEYRRALQ